MNFSLNSMSMQLKAKSFGNKTFSSFDDFFFKSLPGERCDYEPYNYALQVYQNDIFGNHISQFTSTFQKRDLLQTQFDEQMEKANDLYFSKIKDREVLQDDSNVQLLRNMYENLIDSYSKIKSLTTDIEILEYVVKMQKNLPSELESTILALKSRKDHLSFLNERNSSELEKEIEKARILYEQTVTDAKAKFARSLESGLATVESLTSQIEKYSQEHQNALEFSNSMDLREIEFRVQYMY